MSAQLFEEVLARLYTDAELRERFLRDANEALREFALTAEERADLVGIDRAGLVMAAHSFQHKREKRPT